MRYTALAAFTLLLLASTAHAEWLEASSDHFVIYGDEDEKKVYEFAERLERFHAATLRRQMTFRNSSDCKRQTAKITTAFTTSVYSTGTPRVRMEVVSVWIRIAPTIEPSG